MSYRAFFGLAGEPFRADLDLDAILQTDDLLAVHERLRYTVRLGAMALVTGEVGAGKSTALRWAAGQLHPSKIQESLDNPLPPVLSWRSTANSWLNSISRPPPHPAPSSPA